MDATPPLNGTPEILTPAVLGELAGAHERAGDAHKTIARILRTAVGVAEDTQSQVNAVDEGSRERAEALFAHGRLVALDTVAGFFYSLQVASAWFGRLPFPLAVRSGDQRWVSLSARLPDGRSVRGMLRRPRVAHGGRREARIGPAVMNVLIVGCVGEGRGIGDALLGIRGDLALTLPCRSTLKRIVAEVRADAAFLRGEGEGVA